MARIKQVINERRVAYEKAVNIQESEINALHDAQVLEHLVERRIMNRKEKRLRKEAKAKAIEEAKKAEVKATPQEVASQTAAAGLFGSSKVKVTKEAKKPEVKATPQGVTSQTAAAGLFGSSS